MKFFRWRQRKDEELNTEIQQHLDEAIRDRIAGGEAPDEARANALREFGNVGLIKEVTREMWGWGTIERLMQDLRFGLRMLRKQKGVTVIAVLSLALGVGANTALFSVVDAMLLKRLPVKEPEQLVLFQTYTPREFRPGGYGGSVQPDAATGQVRRTSFPYVSYQRMREQQPDTLTDLFAFSRLNVNLLADGQADVANGHLVTGNYYAALGLQPALGRLLNEADDKAAAEPVAVLGYQYWQRFFGGKASVIGQQIKLNNRAFTVVGVTPPGFEGTGQVGATEQVTIPLALEPLLFDNPQQSQLATGGPWFLRVMGRLRPGATQAQAQGQLEAAFRQSIAEQRAARNVVLQARGDALPPLAPQEYPRLVLASGSQGEMETRERYAPALYLLFGVVGLVLLIACANVANLLLARASARQKEISVRLALGASRGRLLRQLLTESVMLASAGGAAGLLFAWWLKDGLLAVGEWGPRALEPALDARVFGFTIALSLLTGIVFGLAPAWRATQVDLTPTLKDSGRSSSAASRSWLSRGLVVMQVALSLVLLIGAGLFVRTLVNLQRADLGFNANNLLTFRVAPSLSGYKNERLVQLYDRITERLSALPGVNDVTFSAVSLLAQNSGETEIYLRNALTTAPPAAGHAQATGNSFGNIVSENFLATMEIPLLAGRALTAQDDARAPQVAIVNQAFANKFFPHENPIGKRFGDDPKEPDAIEIVGLVKDAKYASQRAAAPPTVYFPWRQRAGSLFESTIAIRTAGDPNHLAAAVRQAMREVDETLPLRSLKTQIEQADETLRMERLFAKLVTLFGLLAQTLAAIGLFGVLAYAVSTRTHEIGIRMALGAGRYEVLKLIVKQGMALSLIGLTLGLTGAYGLTKYLESRMQLSKMLYGIKPTDPLTYGVVATLLIVVALLACYLPARRATKVDPLIALRHG